MKKALIIICGIILIIILQTLSALGFLYNYYIKRLEEATRKITMPVAAVDIPKGTYINSYMITSADQTNNASKIDNSYYFITYEIIGKIATKDIKKNDMFSTDNIMSQDNGITFNHTEGIETENEITTPFLNYNNINYYYTNSYQRLEVSYLNKKYTIDDAIRLNVLSLQAILNESSSNEEEPNGKIYKYRNFNIQMCNNNNLYITGNKDLNNYCK